MPAGPVSYVSTYTASPERLKSAVDEADRETMQLGTKKLPPPDAAEIWSFPARIIAVLFVVGLVIGVLSLALAEGFPTAWMKIGAAGLGVYGTFAQLYLASEQGSTRRTGESDTQYDNRLYWRDRGDLLAWLALGISVLAVAAAEVRDAH